MLLDQINYPQDLKSLNNDDLKSLCAEIRDVLINKLSLSGGHVGPNLGIVELTTALHYVFDCPKDKIVFDVSHQSYAHKILTGRKDYFINPELFNKVSGYTDPNESIYDNFVVGHTSSSISLLAGLMESRDLLNQKYNAIAIIGDGSLSGGLAFEGLDNLKEIGSNAIIIVNDNGMSIAENHGGIYDNLKLLRESNGTYTNNYFTSIGLDYIFEQNGNDIESLIKLFTKLKNIDHPIVVHIITNKGLGLKFAQNDKENWHSSGPFDKESGKLANTLSENYNEITGEFLLNKLEQNDNLAIITAGTPSTIAFNKQKREKAGKHYIDVGIAESHAITFASSLAKNGIRPIFPVYSSFIQRAYDQLAQDVGINKSPIIVLLVGSSVYALNSVTHCGIYDISMISNIPNIIYLAPTSKEEYLDMLDWAIEQTTYPVVIKVPGVKVVSRKTKAVDYSIPQYKIESAGSQVCILGLGTFFPLAQKIQQTLLQHNINATLVNPMFASFVDEITLNKLKQTHNVFVTIEDGILDGGFGQKIASFLVGTKVFNFAIKKGFYDRYDANKLLEENDITCEKIVQKILININDFINSAN